MSDRLAEVGAVFQGRYAIEREVGRGGTATVYLAQDLRLHRPVAVKLLHADLAAALGTERFLREIDVASRLIHPNILPIHDSGEVEGRLFYVMPYVQGQSLRQVLEREPQLPIEETVRIIRAVAAALEYLHQAGFVHRDIKPENVLLAGEPGGGSPQPLLADFGLVRALNMAGGERLTAAGLALGTPLYMSPEQAAGGPLDGRSDIYALGCLAYEMLSGAPPFTGGTAQAIMARHAVDPAPRLQTVRPTVPDTVARAIARALAKVPTDRFATAAEFADALVAKAGFSVHRQSHARLVQFASGGTIVLGLAMMAALSLRTPGGPAIPPSAAAIAVMPFSSASVDTALTRLGGDLAIAISASLNGVGGIQTIDRLSVAAATAGRGGMSVTEAAKHAHRLGARSTLHGTMVGDGDRVRIDVGLYETRALSPLVQGITVVGHADSLGALTDSIVWSMLRQLWRGRDPPSPSLAAVTTGSLAALRAFLDGERLIELDRWDEAELAYGSAIAADSTFWLARFRYQQTLWWRHLEVDLEQLDVLHQHREMFPEPDRLLLDAWSESQRNSAPFRFDLFRQVTQRFPHYWPGWLALGDFLLHGGGPMLLGSDWRTAQDALQRAVDLNPRLLPVWLHLYQNSIGKDPAESGRALSKMLELTRAELSGAEPEHAAHVQRLHRLAQEIARAGGVIPPGASALADSVVSRQVMRNTTVWPNPWLILSWGFPAAQAELSQRVLRRAPSPRLKADHLRGLAWAWAERGRWDSALAAMSAAVKVQPDPLSESGPTGVDEYALAVLGAWLGTIPPTEALDRNAAARALVDAEPDSGRKAELLGTIAWLDGILAFARGSASSLERARVEGGASAHRQAKLVDRSLAAFGRALAGDRSAAGRELAALEWECAKQFDCFTDIPSIAVQRLAAATWLLEEGDTAQAARLLIWHEATMVGWDGEFSYVATPLAYLMLARIEEARGDSGTARAHYQQFLRRYDSPMPGRRHLVEEARMALERLAGAN